MSFNFEEEAMLVKMPVVKVLTCETKNYLVDYDVQVQQQVD
jgi:hypothetical protein